MDLALNNQQWLISHKTKSNQFRSLFFYSSAVMQSEYSSVPPDCCIIDMLLVCIINKIHFERTFCFSLLYIYFCCALFIRGVLIFQLLHIHILGEARGERSIVVRNRLMIQIQILDKAVFKLRFALIIFTQPLHSRRI